MNYKISKGFDYADGKHFPTVKIYLDPCGPDDTEAWNNRDALAERIEQIIAAPVVERQERVEGLTRYRTMASGRMTACDQGFYVRYSDVKKLYAEQPAPVAAVNTSIVPALVRNLEAVIDMFTPLDRTCNRTLVDARACLDKVKELNPAQAALSQENQRIVPVEPMISTTAYDGFDNGID